jgi:subfamily B ATP-binding cassette protein MsbA
VNAFKRLLRYAEPYRGRLIVALVAMVVYAVGNGIIAKLIKDIVDGLLAAQQTGIASGVADQVNHGRVGTLAIWILSAYLLKGIGAWASSYLMADVGQRVVRDLRNTLFRHILDQSAAFFARASSGQLVSKITNDVNQIQQAASETIADLTRETLTVVALAVWLFIVDWRLAIVVLTGAPLAVYPLVRLGQRVRSTTRPRPGAARAGDASGRAELQRPSHREGLRRGGPRDGEVRASTSRLYRTNMRITGAMASLPPLMEFIGGVAAVAALWYGTTRIAQGLLTPGAFASFLGTAFMMYGPIKKLSRVNAGCSRRSRRPSGSSRCSTRTPRSWTRRRAGAAAHVPVGRVPRRRLCLRRSRRRMVLEHVSFTVAAGQVVAIVGLSGAGKTTLVNLIPRFYDVTRRDPDRRRRHPRRDAAIAARPDRARHAGDRALRRHDRREHRVRRARRAARRSSGGARAHAHEFIVDLPDGYDARIGERGQRLSGGQRSGWRSRARCSRTVRCSSSTRRPRRSTRVGAARAGRAGQPHAQPHDLRDRAPAVHRPPRGSDRRARRGRRCRDGHARHARGSAGRRVRQALCAAGVRRSAGTARTERDRPRTEMHA